MIPMLVLVLWLCGAPPNPPVSGAETSRLRAASLKGFQLLKTLEGDWQGTIEGAGPETAKFAVTSHGSVVVATSSPGTPKEMITVFYLDRGRLAANHYCAGGNQPHLVLSSASSEERLNFTFAGGTNLDAKVDSHMHAHSIVLVAPGHIRLLWKDYTAGKEDAAIWVDLRRTVATGAK